MIAKETVAAGRAVRAAEEGAETLSVGASKGASTIRDGAEMTTNEALDAASSQLGSGYREIAPGVFKSADGTKVVRMTESDLAKTGNHAGAQHMNFETGKTVVKPNGKESLDSQTNAHVFLKEEK